LALGGGALRQKQGEPRLPPSSARNAFSPIGVSPPRKAAGAAITVSSAAPRHGVIPARANRTVLPATTTTLHSSEITGSGR
jgi:hypothetical protein